MRALGRYFLAPLVVAAAFFAAGGQAHAAVPAHQAAPQMIRLTCPAGTNWDAKIGACV